ncbi:MAG: ribose-phosphate pyrophosphokinase [Simkaniaceae bacterium]
MNSKKSFMLFSGTSHPEFAKAIADHLGIGLGEASIVKFPDNEIGVQILENVRGRDVFLVQSVALNPNLYLMELLIMIDALKRASAREIVAVMPYFGYARQDRKDKGRVPITAKLVANLLETAGATRVLTMDLHSEQIQGFFDIPVDNLYGFPTLADSLAKRVDNPVIVAPDLGSVKLMRAFASRLGADVGIVEKRRVGGGNVEMRFLIGNVEKRNVILIDDICSTAVTLKEASRVVKEAGAQRVLAAITHGLFVGDCAKKSFIETLVKTDTIPLREKAGFNQIETISVAPLFARAIESIVLGESIQALCLDRT